jgi:hypothetical protein
MLYYPTISNASVIIPVVEVHSEPMARLRTWPDYSLAEWLLINFLRSFVQSPTRAAWSQAQRSVLYSGAEAP